jgi:hypothetical protein
MDEIKLSDLRAAYKLFGVSVEVEKIPHLRRVFERYYCDGKDSRYVYIWRILASEPKDIRKLYGMGEKSFQALEKILRQKVGDSLVDEWLGVGHD